MLVLKWALLLFKSVKEKKLKLPFISTMDNEKVKSKKYLGEKV